MHTLKDLHVFTVHWFILLFLVLAYNPNSSRYTREKYRKRLQKFEKQCHMIPLLMNAMKYKDTQKTQNPDFETHMKSFLALAK